MRRAVPSPFWGKVTCFGEGLAGRIAINSTSIMIQPQSGVTGDPCLWSLLAAIYQRLSTVWTGPVIVPRARLAMAW